jgi:hypothetical protein
MNNERASLQIDRDKLFALLTPPLSRAQGSGGSGGQPNPDEPLKPGPWDPVIRVALKDVLRFGPQPEPWRLGFDPSRFGPTPEPWSPTLAGAGLLAAIGRRLPQIWDVIGSLNPADLVALNPQPLPPRERFVRAAGEALAARAEQLAEVAGAVDGGEKRGIIIVGGYVNRLVDDWCGNGFRPRWPFPGPPPWWFREEIGGRDILVLGAALHQASREAFDPAVGRALDDGAARLVKVGLERM